MNQLTTIDLAKVQQVVGEYIKGCFKLPKVEGKQVFYVIPMSGGIDSFTVAYTMTALFPDEKFIYFHADTGVEAKGTSEALERFEAITGKKIIRLIPKYDLFETIERSGNYLPSQRVRSCTAAMKTVPSKLFYKQLRQIHGDDAVFINMVGIRADETERSGIEWKESYIASVYPLQGLGLTKPDVNNILENIQGIPVYYREKSRSGCICCPFSRRSEIAHAWVTSKEQMERAARMEELPAQLVSVYNSLPPALSRVTGIARNWLKFFRPSKLSKQYPVMPFEGVRGKKPKNDTQIDMFGMDQSKRLFVAVEYEYYSNSFGMCSDSFVYMERAITYSTTLGGLKTSLKHWWHHRLMTKELHQASEQELMEGRKVFILELKINDFEQEIPPSPEGIYTWQSDRRSLYSIRKTMAVIENILLAEGLYQDVRSSHEPTQHQAKVALSHMRATKTYGEVLSSYEYEKPLLEDLIDDADIEDAPVACLACSR